VRQAVRRLVEHGALNLLERSKAGHVVDVRLPMEIPAVRARSIEDRRPMEPGRDVSLEEIDFLQTRTLRGAIHAREERGVFLLPEGKPLSRAVPRPRGATSEEREQFLSQPGFLLPAMQLPERRTHGRGLSPLAVPQTSPDRCRTQRASPRPR
jgi:hypothetical protein